MYFELWQIVGNGGNKKLFVDNASLFVYNFGERDLNNKIKKMNTEDCRYFENLYQYFENNVQTSPLQRKKNLKIDKIKKRNNKISNSNENSTSQQIKESEGKNYKFEQTINNKLGEQVSSTLLKNTLSPKILISKKSIDLNDEYLSNLSWRYNHMINGTEQIVSPNVFKKLNEKLIPIKPIVKNSVINNGMKNELNFKSNSKRTSPEFNEKLVQKIKKDENLKRNMIKENISLIKQLNEYNREQNLKFRKETKLNAGNTDYIEKIDQIQSNIHIYYRNYKSHLKIDDNEELSSLSNT